MDPVVIGFSGKKGHGKDKTASFVKARLVALGYTVEHIPLAQALKEEVAALVAGRTGESRSAGEILWAMHQDGLKEEFRVLLQSYGTDYCRKHIADDYWLMRCGERILALDAKPKTAVLITDVRFPDEAAWVKDEWNGVVVRVNRPGCVSRKAVVAAYMGLPAPEEHISETALDDYHGFDYTIENTGDLAYLSMLSRHFCLSLQDRDIIS